MDRIKRYLGKFSYLGFWASNASSLSKILYFLNELNEHPPIRLHKKKLFNFRENLGELAKKV